MGFFGGEVGPGEAAWEAGAIVSIFRGFRGSAKGVAAGFVVVSAASGVGEGVVGVVDLLEALCAGGAFGGVGGNAVGVVF